MDTFSYVFGVIIVCVILTAVITIKCSLNNRIYSIDQDIYQEREEIHELPIYVLKEQEPPAYVE